MIEINLLKEERQTGKGKIVLDQDKKLATYIVGAGVVLLLILAFWWWRLGARKASLEEQISDAEKKKNELNEIIQAVQAFEDRKIVLQKKLDLIDELKKNQIGPAQLLEELARILPESLWLDSLTERDMQVTINGGAASYNTVANFYAALDQSAYFSNVDLKNAEEKEGKYKFTLSCDFIPSPQS
jgi:type IV pilus assembly protein PilN